MSENLPDEILQAVQSWGNAITWTGTIWRDFIESDLQIPGVIAAQRIQGSGGLDPRITVVTTKPYRGMVNTMHKRFWKKN